MTRKLSWNLRCFPLSGEQMSRDSADRSFLARSRCRFDLFVVEKAGCRFLRAMRPLRACCRSIVSSWVAWYPPLQAFERAAKNVASEHIASLERASDDCLNAIDYPDRLGLRICAGCAAAAAADRNADRRIDRVHGAGKYSGRAAKAALDHYLLFRADPRIRVFIHPAQHRCSSPARTC